MESIKKAFELLKDIEKNMDKTKQDLEQIKESSKALKELGE